MNTKIKQLKVKGVTYDIDVAKDWNQNDPSAVDFIKNKTHGKNIKTTYTNISDINYHLYSSGDPVTFYFTESIPINPAFSYTAGKLYKIENADISKITSLADITVVEDSEISKSSSSATYTMLALGTRRYIEDPYWYCDNFNDKLVVIVYEPNTQILSGFFPDSGDGGAYYWANIEEPGLYVTDKISLIDVPITETEFIKLDRQYLPEDVAYEADLQTIRENLGNVELSLGESIYNNTEWVKQEAKEYTDSAVSNIDTTKDWSQNDPSAVDYIKNRTHYPEVAIRAETTASQEGESTFYGMFTSRLDVESLVGKIITLDINGNVYQYELKRELYEDEHVLYCVGGWLEYLNGGTSGFSAALSDTGINFLLPEFYGKTAPSTIPVSISYIEIPLKQLDEKYIPAGISRTTEVNTIKNTLSSEINRIKDKDWEQTDESAGDFIKNRTHGKQAEIFTGNIYVGDDYSKDHIWVDTNFEGHYSEYDFSFDLVRVFDEEYDIDKFTCSEIEYDGTEHSTWHQKNDEAKVFYNIKMPPSWYDGEQLCNGIAVLTKGPTTVHLSSMFGNPAGIVELHTEFTIPSKGLWITRYATVKDATLVKYNYKQLDEKYIPDTIARVADRTHYEDIIDVNEILIENKLFTALPDIEEEGIYGHFEYVGPEEADYTKDITEHCNTITINVNDSVFEGKLTYDSSTERYAAVVDAVSGSLCYDYNLSAEVYIKGNTVYFVCGYFAGDGGFYADKIAISGTKTNIKQLDEKYIPDTIARVDQYDKYGKDSFSVNDTAKAISAKSAAFGYNTQAGSYAFTVLDLDATNKTFTLDSTEGLNVGDIYTVDISFYNKSDVATEELFVDYGKITEISENVVTVDVFPDTVSRYRYSGNPYVDSNGIDREENVFRVIAKPTVGTRAIGTATFVSGNASQALSKNAVSIGTLNVAYGPHSVALGATNTANYAATALGIGNNANGKRSIAAGNGNSTSGYIAVAIGNENEATGMFSVGIGSKNTSSGTGSVALGVNNQSDWASSVAIGELNVSSGNCSVALGRQNTSSGGQSFTGGFNNTASGQFSVAIGNQNKALEQGAVALGSSNTSSGINSVSLGNANTASNKNAFAVGTKNKASGSNSASIGNNNEASGSASFAQGYQAKATNECCVALGNNSKASGKNSFALGPRAEASGTTSVAIGQGVKSARSNQIVFGKYNIMDTSTSNSYAVIVGNGSGEDITDDSGNITTQNRSNAHTLDWKGNAWFAGAVSASSIKIGEVEFTSAQLIKVLNFIDSIEG